MSAAHDPAGTARVLAPAADQAMAIAGAWDLITWTCVAIYVLVLAGLAVAVLRRQRQPRAAAGPERGMRTALVGWVVFVVVVLTVFVAASYLADRALHGGDPQVDVKLTARQWWWQVEYPHAVPAQQVTTANELHLPVGRTARIELHSADVIHSFWVPELGGKEDLVPGRTNAVWITPRRVGRFRGQCAEFCGLQHAHMALDVVVHDAAGFERWRRSQLAPAQAPRSAGARRGQEVFLGTACATCHAVRGTPAGGRTAPDLTHVASRPSLAAGTLPMTREAMDRWIADPQHAKPGVEMPRVPLRAADRAALVDYLLELR